MNPENPNRQYYPALDGLRGLAILLVVVYHNFGFIDYFFFGWLGVDLFFVLSGFLITDILLKTVERKDFLKNFYIRRALRIFPLYYFCLVLFLFVVPVLSNHFTVKYYTDNQVFLWTYLQNWLFIFKEAGQTTGLHHLWSLAVEEQFYLIWPLVILAFKKPKILFAFITIVLLLVIAFRLWIWIYDVTNLAYFNLYTFSRIDGLCIGCLVALLQKIDTNFLKKYTFFIVLFFAIANLVFFFINRSSNFSFPYLALIGYTTFAMIFGLLVNEAVTKETKIINVVFTITPLRFLGKISYGLYIFHWPVYLILRPYLPELLPELGHNSYTNLLSSIIITLIGIFISWLSYHYFEKRFLDLKNKFI
jgi:peptidoglycan/LPS O-acetylase OafA/YrhL